MSTAPETYYIFSKHEPFPEPFPQGGIFLIDKPFAWTSFDVVKKVRGALVRRTGQKKLKVGHAGTLDPLATGLLIVCVGKYTPLIDTLQAGGGALEITVVKGEHHGAAVLGIENLAEAVLETPIVLVGAFEEEARRFLRGAREVFLFLFVSSGGGDVGHGRVG